jgi:hypothetical protein
MPALSIRFRKRHDADALLVLVREDGSSTTGAIGPAHGYGPVHDLAHFVAESTLGLSEGFLGLVASGWEIRDFEVKGASRQLPEEALYAESIAGELSREEMMQQYSSPEDFTWSVETWLRQARPQHSLPGIAADALATMRDELVKLRWSWMETAPGDELALSFSAPRRSSRPRPQHPVDASRKRA